MSGLKTLLALLPALFACGASPAGDAAPRGCYPGSPVYISSECLEEFRNYEIGEMNWGRTNGTAQDTTDNGTDTSDGSLEPDSGMRHEAEVLQNVLIFEIGDIDWGRKPGRPASANGSSSPERAEQK